MQHHIKLIYICIFIYILSNSVYLKSIFLFFIYIYLIYKINPVFVFLQSNSMICEDLFTAVKQLADSEIELIKTIENSKKINNIKNIKNTMSTTDKKSVKKSTKVFNVNIKIIKE